MKMQAKISNEEDHISEKKQMTMMMKMKISTTMRFVEDALTTRSEGQAVHPRHAHLVLLSRTAANTTSTLTTMPKRSGDQLLHPLRVTTHALRR